MYIRTTFVMALCLICRSISFLSTSLPGPAPHCQPSSTEYSPPETIYDVLFTLDAFKGCGDLIFSSHTTLCFTLILTVHVYSPQFFPKKICHILSYCVFFPIIAIMAILIIAARKHYTVDIVVALYTTPLLYYASYYFMDDLEINDINDSIPNPKNSDNVERQHLLVNIY